MVTKLRTQRALKPHARIEAERTNLYGPPPINYLRRVREAADLSVQAMADKVGVTKQAMIRLEQGTYQTILPAVLDYYVANYPDSELSLVDAYESFQEQMRKRHFKYFGDDLSTGPADQYHPFIKLRARIGVNPTEVAKALCIPQATIIHFENKPLRQQTVPKIIQNVLKDIGYTSNQIALFESDYTSYRRARKGMNFVAEAELGEVN